MGNPRYCRKIGEPTDWVHRRFGMDQFRVRPHGRRQVSGIRGIDEAHLDPHPGQRIPRQFSNPGVGDIRHDAMISSREKC